MSQPIDSPGASTTAGAGADTNLQHHFATAHQQKAAAKLGMWIFLVQEVLFFSGLFVAYTVFRFFYPETFLKAHEHLNVTLGTINTLVLLASSLTGSLTFTLPRRSSNDTNGALSR